MQGFSIPSDDGTILISSEVPGLFLAGVYAHSLSKEGTTSFPSYGGSLTGNRTYTFSLPVVGAYPPPVMFLYPGAGNSTGYGLLQIDKVDQSWHVLVIQAGTEPKAPRLYAYATLSEVKEAGTRHPVGTAGLQVMSIGGEVYVDTRYQHLAVIASPTLTHDPMPCDGGKPGADTYTNKHDYTYVCPSLQKDMQCTNSTVSVTTAVPSTGSSEYMFMLTAGAQASYTRVQRAYFTSKGGKYAPDQDHDRMHIWGCRYQAVVGISGSAGAVVVTAAWAHYRSSYYSTKYVESDDVLAAVATWALGSVLGPGISRLLGLMTEGSTDSVGGVPYSEETINNESCVVPVVAMTQVLLERPATLKDILDEARGALGYG